MKLIEMFALFDTVPTKPGDDLCGAMDGTRCPLKLPLDKAMLLCGSCPLSENDTLSEEICLAIKDPNSSDQ